MEELKYVYTFEDKVRDAIGALSLFVWWGSMIWIAFALDVMTTGM